MRIVGKLNTRVIIAFACMLGLNMSLISTAQAAPNNPLMGIWIAYNKNGWVIGDKFAADLAGDFTNNGGDSEVWRPQRVTYQIQGSEIQVQVVGSPSVEIYRIVNANVIEDETQAGSDEMPNIYKRCPRPDVKACLAWGEDLYKKSNKAGP